MFIPHCRHQYVISMSPLTILRQDNNATLNHLKKTDTLSRGTPSASLNFASLLNRGHLLKKRICSPRSKFFPLRVDPTLKGCTVQESKQEVIKVVSLCKNDRKSWKYTHTPYIHANRQLKFLLPCSTYKVLPQLGQQELSP